MGTARAWRGAIVVGFGVWSGAGCTTSDRSAEPIDAVPAAIISGTADPAPTSVVGIVSEHADGGSSRIRCTGTLVAPNVVLSARHCVEDVEIVSCLQEFSGVQKWPTLAIRTDVARHEIVRIHFPETKNLCGDDIALFVLADAVPATEAPAAAVRSSAPPVEGEGYSAVGYGRRCGDGGSHCSGGTRLRRDALAVECLECRPRAFRGTTDSICSGDSGGPALDASGVVFGIAAASGIGCTSSYYNRVDVHGAFLRKIVREETIAAGIAPPAWTIEPVDAGSSEAAVPTPAPVVAAEPDVVAETASAPLPAPADASGCGLAILRRRDVDGSLACAGIAFVIALGRALRRRIT